MYKVSVIVPCFNEEGRVYKGIQTILYFLRKQNYSWEVIFVDDGSTDKTKKIIQSNIKKMDNVKLISYPQNKGKGYAIKTGVEHSNGKYIFFSDIDFSVPPETINVFLNQFKTNHDALIGSRRLKKSKIIQKQNIIRETMGRGFSLLVKLLIDPKISDATCGFKAFEQETAKIIFKKVTIYHWAFDAEIIYICKKLKIEIVQIPVIWNDVKGSKVNIYKDSIQSLLGLIKIRINGLQSIYVY